jgi:serine protease Do
MSALIQRRAALLAAAAGLILWQGQTLSPAQAFAADLPTSFSSIIRTVSPAVVNIQSERDARADGQAVTPFDFPRGTPFEDLFRRFRDQQQGGQQPGVRQVAQGSGFIIDPAGYIVTNNHVIDKASKISVTLDNGKKYAAKLIGTDDQTDIALIKVEASQPLPSVEFGDSDKSEVGDWVLAIGNPFGFGGTVTAGIISARGRNLNSGPYDDFLQIDAPINLGNSGGPLFALDGKVIGINSAIVTPSQGSVGIGFSIPSNEAKPVIAQLKDKGAVARGWLGVQIQPVSDELAEALTLDRARGALVSQVVADGPAAAAGFKEGDVITGFNGQAVNAPRDLLRVVAATPAGRSVTVELWRDRTTVKQTVTLAARPKDEVAALPGPDASGDGTLARNLGATLSPITRELRDRYGIPGTVTGVVVTDLARSGAAENSGLRPGDVIQKVGSHPVTNPSQVEAEVKAQADPRRPVLLQVIRQGTPLFVAVRVG